MKKLRINASKSYDILIENDLFSNITQRLPHNKLLFVTDSNVFALYGKKLEDMLKTVGADYCIYKIEAGEKSKNSTNFINILNFAAENKLSRSDAFISFGGGVCGDLCGFAASVYLRGISFIQIPTTLLAMVDSSVGGKTAIDLDVGKNLVGSFYQPSLVICDPNFLSTLPHDVFNDGMAEVIKYVYLKKSSLSSLLSDKNNLPLEDIIYLCVSIKKEFVEKDEYDTGARQLLNFGHTVGHAIEKLSGYTVSHGKAVAMGMFLITKSAVSNELCNKDTLDLLTSLLTEYGLLQACKYSTNELYNAILSDKKRFSDVINLIIPAKDGVCEICPTKLSCISAFLEKGGC